VIALFGAGTAAAQTCGFCSDNNTGSGNDALESIHSFAKGTQNSAFGHSAFNRNMYGIDNTAIGVNALLYNVAGSFNTAIGDDALKLNNADNNTATGLL